MTEKTQVRSGEVIYVAGNDLVVKTDDGQVKHIQVPEGATATVDGQQVAVHDLKPGTKLQRTITTTTTPETVTTVRTIKGQVWQVQPPVSVILRLPNGTNKQYKIPAGQKFDINGKQTDAWGLKKGMNVTATAITERPDTMIAQTGTTTGEAPPPPETPPQEGALLVEEEVVSAPTEVAQAEQQPMTLPQTASDLPVIGFVGVLALAIGLKLKTIRTEN